MWHESDHSAFTPDFYYDKMLSNHKAVDPKTHDLRKRSSPPPNKSVFKVELKLSSSISDVY